MKAEKAAATFLYIVFAGGLIVWVLGLAGYIARSASGVGTAVLGGIETAIAFLISIVAYGFAATIEALGRLGARHSEGDR